MKKLLIFILTIVIVFNAFSFNVFASSTNEKTWYEKVWDGTIQLVENASDVYNLAGVNFMTYAEVYRVCYQNVSGFALVVSTYDAKATTVGAGMKYFCDLIKSGKTPSEAVQIMDNSITVNQNGDRTIIGDGNNFIQGYYDENTVDMSYVNMYVANANYLNPNEFQYSSIYNFCKQLMNNNPEYWFVISYRSYGGDANYYHIFCTNQSPLGGVVDKQYWGMDKVEVDLFTDSWNQNFELDAQGNKAMIEVSTQNKEDLDVHYVDSNGDYIYINESQALSLDLDNILVPDSAISQVPQNDWVTFETVYVYGSMDSMLKDYRADGFQIAHNLLNRKGVLFHGAWGSGVSSLDVFSNINALKKGTAGLSTQQALPTFNGNGINNSPISDSTIQQAEEIINNYYDDQLKNKTPNGNGSSNNNNDDDDKETLWDILTSAIKHIIDLVIDVIGSGIDKLAELFEKLVGLFDDVARLIGGGFSDLVEEFFPYIPHEWVTLVTFSIGLTLFFWVLKKFL